MIAGILGLAGFVLVLFTVGAFMEEDLGKMAKFGGALLVCLGLIAMTAGKQSHGSRDPDEDCVRYSQFASSC